jgi:hypothetical protein
VAAGGQLTPNLVVIGGLRTDNQDCVGFLPPSGTFKLRPQLPPGAGADFFALWNQSSGARWELASIPPSGGERLRWREDHFPQRQLGIGDKERRMFSDQP